MNDGTIDRLASVRRVASGRRGLLAAADPAVRTACVAALAEVGMMVSVVASGVDAVVEARQLVPDLLLVDTQLQDVPGRQAVGWLRGNPALSERPLVMLVDSSLRDAHTWLVGPSRVLRKPVSMSSLVDLIGTLFGADDAE